jgi:hypothetical protein
MFLFAGLHSCYEKGVVGLNIAIKMSAMSYMFLFLFIVLYLSHSYHDHLATLCAGYASFNFRLNHSIVIP